MTEGVQFMTEEGFFSGTKTVRGMNLIEFLDWARESDEIMADDVSKLTPRFGFLALPPVQRTPIWGPKQIVDLWDSALRGFPLGSFYLVPGPSDRIARSSNSDAINRKVGEGWDLLDGQQRLRALLLGLRPLSTSRSGPDRRCVWVDLSAHSSTHYLSLHLTSESQPFGYHPEYGTKLSEDERRKARACIEDMNNRIRLEGRDAYNHELFCGFIDNKLQPTLRPPGWREGWPPPPKVDPIGWTGIGVT